MERRRALKSPHGPTQRSQSAMSRLVSLAIAQDGFCGICHDHLGELALCNVDHIVPISRGGTNRWSNVQATHIRCNGRKGNELPCIEETRLRPRPK